jgi:hypothetical protein
MTESFWQRLLDFFRSPREPYVAEPEPFLRLDREAVRRELQPNERGQAAGAEDLPPTDATGPDSREVSITRYCQNALDRAYAQVTKGIDTFLASIRGISGTAAEAQISQLRETGVSEIKSVAKQQRNQIEMMLRHATNLEAAFARFRDDNRRDALPDLSKGGPLFYAVLVLMVAAETAANGVLFAQGNDFGLLGGFAQAGVFASANIVLGVITALAMRQALHVAWWRRIPMGLSVACLALIGLALNLGVAQFRDALLVGVPQNEATKTAIKHLQTGSVAPGDLISWLLFAMGYTFFWAACADVMRMRDPYPGYAGRYSSLIRAQEDYAQVVAKTHASLAAIRDQFSRRITEVAQQREAYAHHAAALRDHLARLSSSYERYGADVREFHHQLIEDYRDANRGRRSTPVPSYFSLWTDLEQKPLPVYEISLESTDVAKIAPIAVSELTAIHDRELETLLPLSELRSSVYVDTRAS